MEETLSVFPPFIGWDRTADPDHGDYEILTVDAPAYGITAPVDAHRVSAPLPWVLAGDDPNNPQYSAVYSFASRADAAADPVFAQYFGG